MRDTGDWKSIVAVHIPLVNFGVTCFTSGDVPRFFDDGKHTLSETGYVFNLSISCAKFHHYSIL